MKIHLFLLKNTDQLNILCMSSILLVETLCTNKFFCISKCNRTVKIMLINKVNTSLDSLKQNKKKAS